MSMSKRDYQAIARAFYTNRVQPRSTGAHVDAMKAQWLCDVQSVADVLAVGNSRFDRELFLEACETGKCRGMK